MTSFCPFQSYVYKSATISPQGDLAMLIQTGLTRTKSYADLAFAK